MNRAGSSTRAGSAARSVAIVIGLYAVLSPHVASIGLAAEVGLDESAILDQQQNIPPMPPPPGIVAVNLGSFSQIAPRFAQSFEPGYETMVGAAVYVLQSGSGQGNVKVQVGLFDSLDAAIAGGEPIRSAEAKARADNWLEAAWPDEPAAVKVGTTYFLVFSQSTGSDFFAFAGAQGFLPNDPYPPGGGYQQFGSSFVPLSDDRSGLRIDLAFRTYAIPEPGSALLLAAGLCVLAALLRRRLRT